MGNIELEDKGKNEIFLGMGLVFLNYLLSIFKIICLKLKWIVLIYEAKI